MGDLSQEEHATEKVSGDVCDMEPEIGSSSDCTNLALHQTREIKVCQTRSADELAFSLKSQVHASLLGVPCELEASEAETRGNILLILVGLPGSGKSTFCTKMLHSQALKWKRICQDVISNGKRGSKELCLKHTERALRLGFNVLVDRCNLNRDQRLGFLQLARRLNVEAEALVLDLPVKLCIQRAMQRVDHEGGLQGKTAPAAVQRMAQSKEPPSAIEGFSLITRCQTDDDVEKALGFYKKYNGHHDLATWSPEMHHTKGNANFEVKSNVGDHQMVSFGNEQGKMSIRETDFRKLSKNSGELVNKRNNHDHGLMLSNRMMLLDKGAKTLAFPSISTSDFQFDHVKAADIIIDRVSDFLLKYKQWGLRLVFVDLKEDSDMLVRVHHKAAECTLDSERFSILAGDITKLRTSCGVQCGFIANAANWRLKAGGGGVNAAIYKAAGETLEIETKKRAKTMNPGTALVVPLPQASPLHISEGVTHVIHVLGPNMNPQRPNCLQGDYVQGCKLLEDTYSCLFEAFASTVESQVADGGGKELFGQFCDAKGTHVGTKQDKPRDAFTVLMQSAKRRYADDDQNMKLRIQNVKQRDDEGLKSPISSDVVAKCSAESNTDMSGRIEAKVTLNSNVGSLSADKLDITVCSEVEVDKHKVSHEIQKSKRWESWAQALRNAAMHPEEHKDTVLQVTEDAIVMTDLYPKGQKHLLVISRKDGLDSIGDLQTSHLLLLRHMHNLGQTWAKSLVDEDHSLVFRMGYHSDPSMRQLHMHVISQDFNSSFLKNKKHWNSFTTSFFRDSKSLIEELEISGRVEPCGDEAALLKIELRCHRCLSVQPNIPRLKQHIHSCQVPFPSALKQKGYLIMAT